MALIGISKQQCMESLQHYAKTTVRSWNPFTLFRKRKLVNHEVAMQLVQILSKATVTDTDLLTIARAIEGFKDTQLQEDLVSFLFRAGNDRNSSFFAKRKNIDEINGILQGLITKSYRPWWTLFLLDRPYYSAIFREDLEALKSRMNDQFRKRRGETIRYLRETYANDVIAFQITLDYQKINANHDGEEEQLNKILATAVQETRDHTESQLLEALKDTLKNKVPFGKIVISAAGFTAILNKYLSQESNCSKPIATQAQEILYIISKIFLKKHTTALVTSALGLEEVVEAAVSLVSSKSPANPLDTDKKLASAVATVAGGAIGGTLGSVIPGFGTAVGAFVGTVVSKTAITHFYTLLEAWQQAPRDGDSIVPMYQFSYFSNSELGKIFIGDKDRKNILDPIYQQYLTTERNLRDLGDRIAQWLSIYYTLTQNSDGKISEEHLEIISEEMLKLHAEFKSIRDAHGANILKLCTLTADNPNRVRNYLQSLKGKNECLKRLHSPIIGMLNECFPNNPVYWFPPAKTKNPYSSPEMAKTSSKKEVAKETPSYEGKVIETDAFDSSEISEDNNNTMNMKLG